MPEPERGIVFAAALAFPQGGSGVLALRRSERAQALPRDREERVAAGPASYDGPTRRRRLPAPDRRLPVLPSGCDLMRVGLTRGFSPA